MPNRTVVFLGHANPEDNAFARWLSLKLAALGYQVWSDVTKLLGGEDFWREIEPIIRNGTIKYLYVLSRASNHKLGALRELRVASATAKKEVLNDFVIPLRIDDLPHDEINIEIGRLNVIEFSDWAAGLKQLCKKLAADNVPRSPFSGPETVRGWWEREFAADNGVSKEPEIHYSNWFSVQLPSRIYRHSAIGLLDREPRWAFPTRWHELRLVTFASALETLPGLGSLRLDRTQDLNTADFLSEENTQRRDNRNIVTELLREAWEQYALARGLKKHEMAGRRLAFYFDLDSLPNPNVSFLSVDGVNAHRALMGYKTRKSGTLRHWHFAVSAKLAVHPRPMLQVRAHVLFSDDGRNIWSSADAMHKARRSQCKQWWNDDWRDRILATMAWLAGDESSLKLQVSAGSASALVERRPIEFVSPVTLLEPSGSTLDSAPPDKGEEEEDESPEDAESAEFDR